MQKGFWRKIKKPIMALAPMADVTDAAFRQIIARYGKPDVIWTEFVSCDGLCSKGKERLLVDLMFQENERPIVAQLFGAVPKHFYECAQLIQELGLDGIDINMGCPDKSVEKQGAGAALIKNSELAQEIIKETMRGAGNLPVSVKTRIGYNENTMNEWLLRLLDTGVAAITLHARTRREMSLVSARWNVVRDAVLMRNTFDSSKDHTLIIGNGDIKNIEEAQSRINETDADGVMIGRGIFGNPWFFNKEKKEITLEEKLRVMVEHTKLFEKLFIKKTQNGNPLKSFNVMKKHYKAYVNGFRGAQELRNKLMNASNADEVSEQVELYFEESI